MSTWAAQQAQVVPGPRPWAHHLRTTGLGRPTGLARPSHSYAGSATRAGAGDLIVPPLPPIPVESRKPLGPRSQPPIGRRDLIGIVEKAVCAPSSHNTQPWLFRLGDQRIELWADRSRALAINDPTDRELTISCGAALFTAQVAAARAGLDSHAVLCPDPRSPDLLARLHVRWGMGSARLGGLDAAIGRRHTTRGPFAHTAPPLTLIADMTTAVVSEGARLFIVDGEERADIASLVAQGDRIQFGNPAWRRELANWLHSPRLGDGLLTPGPVAALSRLTVRHLNLGSHVAASDETLARDAPVLAVLATSSDLVADWLCAGRALQRALLIAAAQDVQAGFLNQPCQVDGLRPQLAELATPSHHPQLLIRFGVPLSTVRHTRRRPVADVLVDQPPT